MASVVVTYVLWLLGGWIGLHHFYLKRDKQAFLWWCSCGGFIFGWVRDLIRIPAYVDDANDEDVRQPEGDGPPSSVLRWMGQLIFGSLFAYVVRLAIPEDIMADNLFLQLSVHLLIPLAVTIGVHLVGSAGGREEGSFKTSLLAASLPLPWLFHNPSVISYSCMFSTGAYHWTKKWSLRPRKRRPFCRRLAILSLASSIYVCLWISILVFNVKFEGPEGEPVRLSEAILNFFQSQAWKEFKSKAAELWDVFLDEGWDNMWKRFKKDFDISGTQHACDILEVNCEAASQDEIRSACKRLSKQWHPDKHRDKDAKEKAEARFIEVQDACQKLDIKKRKKG